MPSDVTPRRALVLAAGLGTRLDPLTRVRPKPALPVAGEPMIRRIVSWLSAAGVDDVVVNLHHRPESIAAVLGDGSDLGVRVRYSWEQPVVLGSAGGPRKALEVIGEREFLIVNGDTVTDVDLRALAAAHRAGGGMVTMALVPNRWPAQYGGVRLDGQGRVTGFARRGVDAEGSWHFVGVQIATADVFRDVPAGMPASTVGGVYDALLASRPGAVRGFRTDARFYDVGTTADYWGTSWALAGRAGASAEREVAASVLGRRVRVDASAVVSGSLLWDDVEVGAGCRIEDCIVTDGVRVPPHTRWRRRILRVDNGCGLAPREAIEHGLVVSPLEVPQPTGCR